MKAKQNKPVAAATAAGAAELSTVKQQALIIVAGGRRATAARPVLSLPWLISMAVSANNQPPRARRWLCAWCTRCLFGAAAPVWLLLLCGGGEEEKN